MQNYHFRCTVRWGREIISQIVWAFFSSSFGRTIAMFLVLTNSPYLQCHAQIESRTVYLWIALLCTRWSVPVILSTGTTIQWGSHFEVVPTTQALDHQRHIQPIDAPLLMFPLSYSAYSHLELVSWLCWLLNFWLPSHSNFFFLNYFSFITLLRGTHRVCVITTWQIVRGEIIHKEASTITGTLQYHIQWNVPSAN